MQFAAKTCKLVRYSTYSISASAEQGRTFTAACGEGAVHLDMKEQEAAVEESKVHDLHPLSDGTNDVHYQICITC